MAPSKFLSLRISPWGILTAGGSLVCLATILGFFGPFFWFADLFSHFRVQYFLALIILGGLLFLFKSPRTASLYLSFAFVNIVPILPLYFGGHEGPCEESPSYRAMLINVNTLNGDVERVMGAIREADPDILVLEEISDLWINDLPQLKTTYPYSVVETREDNFGIGFFSKFPLIESEILEIGSAEVPSILATVDLGKTSLCVLATHPVPPVGPVYSRFRNEQLESIPDHLPASGPVLVLGDLNVTPWNYHFRKLLQRSGLKDSSKGNGLQPTWPNNNLLLRIPLDHCLHSTDICILDRKIGADVASDHFPLIVDFSMGTKK